MAIVADIPTGAVLHRFSERAKCGPYTHWYSDPATGEPVLLAIQQATGATLHPDISAALAAMEKSGQWLAALYWWEEGEEPVKFQRVTCNFPRADFRTAVSMLQQHLQVEGKRPPSQGNPRPAPADAIPAGAPLLPGASQPEATGLAPPPEMIGDSGGALQQAAKISGAIIGAEKVVAPKPAVRDVEPVPFQSLPANPANEEAKVEPSGMANIPPVGYRWPGELELLARFSLTVDDAKVMLRMMRAGTIAPRFLQLDTGKWFEQNPATGVLAQI